MLQIGCLSDALGMNEYGDFEDNEVTTDDQQDFNSLGSVMSLNELCRPSSLHWRGGAIRRNRWISRSCRAINMSGPPPQPTTHPFNGTLTSQLRCTECGFKVIILILHRRHELCLIFICMNKNFFLHWELVSRYQINLKL